MEKLKKFTSDTKELRLWMQNVNIVGGYAYATEGHVLIRKPTIGKQEQSDVPEHVADTFISLLANLPVENKLKAKHALDIITKHKTEPVYANYIVECDECDSSGIVEYTYEYNGRDYTIEGECPACNGNCGTMVNWNKVLSYRYDSDLRVKIRTATFNPAFLELILTTLGDIEFGFANEKMFFKAGEYEGLLMEHLSNETCNVIDLLKF